MKRLLALLPLLLTFVGMAQAQHTFSNIAWYTSREDVKTQLASAGFTFDKVDEDNDFLFMGQLYGTRTRIMAAFSSKGLECIRVTIITDDPDALPMFDKVKAQLVSKYGTPENDYRIFLDPYSDGDGREMEAVKEGKGNIYSFWGNMYAQVNKNLTVSIQYESPTWSAELERRQQEGGLL